MKNLNDKNQMSKITRRDFMKKAAIATPVIAFPAAGFAANKKIQPEKTIRLGFIGTGGRGTTDTINCLNSAPNVELVAMGDLFEERLESSLSRLKSAVGDKVKVTDKFTGFDAYKRVMECDIDLVMLTSPPHFRPIELKAAVEAGVHVFMEKPVAVDPAGVRSILKWSEEAERKGLTIVGGTQMRRAPHIQNAINLIHNGNIGDLVGGQCFRLGGAMRTWGPPARDPEWSDMEWQMRNWYFYTWLGGDFIVEMHIHNIDIMNWAFDSVPLSCTGFGGRQARTGSELGKWGNVYDHFAVEYMYPGDVRVQYTGTQIDNAASRNDQRLVGTNGNAYIDFGRAIINGRREREIPATDVNPSIQQHADQINAIRTGQSLNDGRQVAESTMTTIMGRMSCYTGQTVTWDWIMNQSEQDFSLPKYEFGDMKFRPAAIPGLSRLV